MLDILPVGSGLYSRIPAPEDHGLSVKFLIFNNPTDYTVVYVIHMSTRYECYSVLWYMSRGRANRTDSFRVRFFDDTHD